MAISPFQIALPLRAVLDALAPPRAFTLKMFQTHRLAPELTEVYPRPIPVPQEWQ
jgi:hypothetical protein